MRIHKDSVFYAAAMFTFSSVGLQLMSFIYRIAMSRFIGAEGMGVFGLVMPVYAVVQSFTLSGLVLAVTRRSAKYEALGRISAVRATLRQSMAVYVVLFAAAALPVLLLNQSIAERVLGDARTRIALLILLPCMLLTGFENLLKAHFQGTRFILPPIVSELSEQFIRIIAVVTLLYLFRGASAGVSASLIVTGMIISEVSSVVLLSSWYTARRRAAPPVHPEPVRESRGMMKGLMRAALPVSLAGLCTNLLASATTVVLPRRLVVSGLAQEEALRAFGVMTGMSIPLVMMPAAFIIPLVSVLVPKLSQSCALGDRADVRRKAAKGLHATGIIAFGAAAVLLPCGGALARLLYNEPTAGGYILPLTASAFFTFYQFVTSGILNGIGRHKLASVSIVMCSVIHLGFTWFACALPRVGMAGYVAGDLLSALFGAGFNLFFIVRHTGLSPRVHNWVIRPMLSFLAAALTARLCISLGAPLLRQWSAVFAAAVCLGVYALTLRFQGASFGRYLKTLRNDGDPAGARPPRD